MTSARLERARRRDPRVDGREGSRGRRRAAHHRERLPQPPARSGLPPEAPRVRSDRVATAAWSLPREAASCAELHGQGDGAPSSTIRTTRTRPTRTRACPPGPIANPGARSLEAAMAPATTHYFFFVARGRGASRVLRDLRGAPRRHQGHEQGAVNPSRLPKGHQPLPHQERPSPPATRAPHAWEMTISTGDASSSCMGDDRLHRQRERPMHGG